MKRCTVLYTAVLFCSQLSAQHCIVRQSGGDSHFYYHAGPNAYTTLVQAFTDANEGDTLHLPGAFYDITSELVLDKKLVIVGTGIDPDSTITTGRTQWNVGDNITITNSANDLEFHGIHFIYVGAGSNFIRFGTNPASSDVDGVLFSRCMIEPIFRFDGSNSGNSLATNTVLEGCIFPIGQIQIRNANPTLIRNSILFEDDLAHAGTGTTVENCILLDVEQNGTGGSSDVMFRNNIFFRSITGLYAPVDQSTFENNLWVLPPSGSLDLSGLLNETGNASTTVIAEVFQDPLPSLLQFDWAYNYHLVPGSGYETLGVGGTQVGIYGGGPLSAWKDGALPFNPHWDHFSAPGSTVGGVLQGVQLRGTAQTH